MRVELLYFAALRDLRGVEAERVALPDGVVRVGDLRAWIQRTHASLDGRLTSVRFAVNERFVGEDHALGDGDVVALIPPVAGGSGDRVKVTEAPLSIDRVVDLVRRPSAGALAIFVGVVRDHHDGKPVEALEYTAYASMAEAEMTRIVDELEAEIDGVRLAVHHRIGALAIGDDAIVCVASSAHRGEAFEAGRALIDRVKERAPIWKKETHPDGARWVGWDDE